MKHFLILTFAMAMAVPATAVVVDGTKDASYGPALSVQTVETGFGDNASEWNAAYGLIDGSKLSLMLTGNLENNFNKLEIFIDSKVGGQSEFDSAGNDNAQNMDGLVFDTGFTADYHLIARRGSGKFDLDFADLDAQTFNFYEDVFVGSDAGAGTTGTGVNLVGIEVGYDGSNVAGILGGGSAAADTAAALAVTTGLELVIDLADLGYAGGDINVMIGQNGGSHDYFSNQFLGGLTAPQGNLGGDGAGGFTGKTDIDFTVLSGDQFFTISPAAVPEPTTGLLALVAVAGLSAVRRK